MARWYTVYKITNWRGGGATIPSKYKDLNKVDFLIDLDEIRNVESVHTNFNGEGIPINVVTLKDNTYFYSLWSIFEWEKILKGEK